MKELAIIQATLNAPKNRHNNHGNYSYRSCEDILEAVKPLLGEAIIFLSDEVILLSDKSIHKQTNKNGETVLESDRVYVKSTATYSMGDFSVSSSGLARESLWKAGNDPSQITGSASSYARKLALSGLLLLDDSKDADSINKHEEAVKNAPPALTLTDTQKTNIESLVEACGMDNEATINGVKWASSGRSHNLDDLSQDEAAKLIGMITKKIEGQKANA